MSNNHTKSWLPLLFGITLSIGMVIGFVIKTNIPDSAFFSYDKKNRLNEIMQLIQNNYVDSIDINKISDTAIQAALEKLDPHTSFIPANELESVNERIRGDFYGIGVEYEIIDDTLTVVNLLKDGPGERAGIQKGDQFISINGKNVAGKKLSEDAISETIRKATETKVNLFLIRNHKKINTIITKEIMNVSNVQASFMLTSDIGYINLEEFSSHAYTDFMNALINLKKKKATSLILDLRGNGGGVLDEAVDIADEFLEGDKLVTYTEGVHSPKKEYRCRRLGRFEKGPLVVLCDQHTASASEILLGALQDWGRATIIGKNSFGKGLVQEQFDLCDHSALRLTIARYYTPFGRCIQRSYANGKEAYYEEGLQQSSDKITLSKKRKSFTSASGKTLFDGGGITPDIYINSDDSMNNLTLALHEKDLIKTFAYHYFMDNKTSLDRYSSVKNFNDSFQINNADWDNFKKTVPADIITPLNESAIKEIKKNLKLFIAKFYFDESDFLQLVNLSDKTILRSLQVLQK